MEDSFNDLSQPFAAADLTSQPPPLSSYQGATPAAASTNGDGSYVPRPKRIACVVCRRRKLRCDGRKPSCGTCSRLGHECAYDEVRKKSGPKRGYVKQLEARLAQVETLLMSQEPNGTQPPATQPQEDNFNVPMQDDPPQAAFEMPDLPDLPSFQNDMDSSISPPGTLGQAQSDGAFLPGAGLNVDSSFGWDMISLGFEEPLPTQDVIDDLNRIYFDKIHQSVPILHKPRYLAAMSMSLNVRPPVFLQYIIWCHAASISDKYFDLHPHFYQRARKYAELTEMKGLGEGVISLACCQTWLLIGMYEFRMMYFPRAWLSVGKCARLVLMMGLNRVDGIGLDVKQCLPPAKDWTEREERRRVFWMAFCSDRYASTGTGWPMMMDERDIMTNLPSSEESFIKSKPQRTLRLADVLAGDGTSSLSPFGSIVLMAALFGRNLTHLHRPDPHDNDHDLNGEFWKRHRSYDNILLNFALCLPNHLRLSAGMQDPNVIFCNMSIHTSTICLHQAAIFKAEKNKMPNQIITESKRRCIVAADQISSIMKIISHLDLTTMNPFMSFCVYVAARVFVQYLKSRPNDPTVQSSLQFVLSALNALRNKNPLTESFLAQLDVDIEGGVFKGSSSYASKICPMSKLQQDVSNLRRHDSIGCSPLISISQSQSQATGIAVETQSDSSSSTGRHNFAGGTSLPNRQKQGSANINGNLLNYSPSSESAGASMDFTPDFSTSEKNNASSDHPTPSTINSSSNTSYSKNDQPSPVKTQLHSSFNPPNPNQAPSLDNGNLMNPSPGSTEYSQFSAGGQYFPTGSEAPLDSTDPAASISISSAWDFATAQASNSGMTPGGMDSLSEAQWAQLLGTTTWDAWRNP